MVSIMWVPEYLILSIWFVSISPILERFITLARSWWERNDPKAHHINTLHLALHECCNLSTAERGRHLWQSWQEGQTSPSLLKIYTNLSLKNSTACKGIGIQKGIDTCIHLQGLHFLMSFWCDVNFPTHQLTWICCPSPITTLIKTCPPECSPLMTWPMTSMRPQHRDNGYGPPPSKVRSPSSSPDPPWNQCMGSTFRSKKTQTHRPQRQNLYSIFGNQRKSAFKTWVFSPFSPNAFISKKKSSNVKAPPFTKYLPVSQLPQYFFGEGLRVGRPICNVQGIQASPSVGNHLLCHQIIGRHTVLSKTDKAGTIGRSSVKNLKIHWFKKIPIGLKQ